MSVTRVWTVRRGRGLFVSAVTVCLAILGAPVLDATPSSADPLPPLPVPAVFTFTGSPQTYVVPDGVTQLAVEAAGGAGAVGGGPALDFGNGGPGGAGGLVHAVVSVTPGQMLTVNVGGMAIGQSGAWPDGGRGGTGTQGQCCGGGASGGSAGGGSSLLTGATPLVVAAGGGGGGGGSATDSTCAELPCAGATTTGGAGGHGGFAGADGTAGGCGTGCASGIDGGKGGGGATQVSGGAAGAGGQAADGSAGSSSSGGAGGDADAFNTGNGGGGGGGGFYGGGGGGASWYGGLGGGGGGGGGGSSFVTSNAVLSEFSPGAQAGPGVVAVMPIVAAAGATAADVEFSIDGTLPTFPCPEGCGASFTGSGSAVGTARGYVGGTTYEAVFTAPNGSVNGSATYTEPGVPFCPAAGSAVGDATLTGSADGVVRRSTTPGVTGSVTGVTVNLDYSYQRVGSVAVILIDGGSVTVSFDFPDSGGGSLTTEVEGAGLGAFVVSIQEAIRRCEDPGALPFQIVGDVVLGPS